MTTRTILVLAKDEEDIPDMTDLIEAPCLTDLVCASTADAALALPPECVQTVVFSNFEGNEKVCKRILDRYKSPGLMLSCENAGCPNYRGTTRCELYTKRVESMGLPILPRLLLKSVLRETLDKFIAGARTEHVLHN